MMEGLKAVLKETNEKIAAGQTKTAVMLQQQELAIGGLLSKVHSLERAAAAPGGSPLSSITAPTLPTTASLLQTQLNEKAGGDGPLDSDALLFGDLIVLRVAEGSGWGGYLHGDAVHCRAGVQTSSKEGAYSTARPHDDHLAGLQLLDRGAAAPWQLSLKTFAVGETLYAVNPEFVDGTRLRGGPRAEAEFNGSHVLNDAAVVLVDVDEAAGFGKVRESGGGSGEGWIRLRNLTRKQRRQGLASAPARKTDAAEGRGAQVTAGGSGVASRDPLNFGEFVFRVCPALTYRQHNELRDETPEAEAAGLASGLASGRRTSTGKRMGITRQATRTGILDSMRGEPLWRPAKPTSSPNSWPCCLSSHSC